MEICTTPARMNQLRKCILLVRVYLSLNRTNGRFKSENNILFDHFVRCPREIVIALFEVANNRIILNCRRNAYGFGAVRFWNPPRARRSPCIVYIKMGTTNRIGFRPDNVTGSLNFFTLTGIQFDLTTLGDGQGLCVYTRTIRVIFLTLARSFDTATPTYIIQYTKPFTYTIVPRTPLLKSCFSAEF